jgi:Cytochrome P450
MPSRMSPGPRPQRLFGSLLELRRGTPQVPSLVNTTTERHGDVDDAQLGIEPNRIASSTVTMRDCPQRMAAGALTRAHAEVDALRQRRVGVADLPQPRFADGAMRQVLRVYPPERWFDGAATSLPRFAFFPFGGGPRSCIGDNFAMMATPLRMLACHCRPSRRRCLLDAAQVKPARSVA